MKKVALMLLISCNVVFSMELPQEPQRGQKRPASEIERPAPKVPAAAQQIVAESTASQQSRTAFELLPVGIKNHILSFLTTASGSTKQAMLDNAAENIRTFFRINTQFAPLGNDPNVIEYLINELANPYANGDKVAAAIALGTESAAKWLNNLVENENPGIRFDTLKAARYHFQKAASEGRINVLKFLVESAPKIQFHWYEALKSAIEHKHANVVRFILFLPVLQDYRSKFANGDLSGAKTFLFIAINNNDESTVDVLLDAGADVNKIDSNGETPLYLAMLKKNDSIIRKLLARGASR